MGTIATMTNVTKALVLAAAMTASLLVRPSFGADSEKIQGPDFQAWDLKFGLISDEDDAWISNAIKNGTLGNREVSCKVYNETRNLVYPLPPEPLPPGFPPDKASWYPPSPARYGLTFEYTTTKPNVPYTFVRTYQADPESPQTKAVDNGYLPGRTTGKTGRFCFYQFSNDPQAQRPGQHCYQVTIEGVPLPQICANVVNPNYVEPNAQ